MKSGDTIYKVWNGKLETAVFLEESIDVANGATAPTWLIRDGGRRSRCSPGMYQATEAEAWQLYQQDCDEAILRLKNDIEEMREQLAFARSENKRVKAILKQLGKKNVRCR